MSSEQHVAEMPASGDAMHVCGSDHPGAPPVEAEVVVPADAVLDDEDAPPVDA
ncbi:Hypothetical protein A7982_10504 [Minicystis rosea]|nr:Hypothetical protein A7982_10504 [Minicystis rosea]